MQRFWSSIFELSIYCFMFKLKIMQFQANLIDSHGTFHYDNDFSVKILIILVVRLLDGSGNNMPG